MRRRYRINYEESPKTFRYLEVWDEKGRVALVYGNSPFDTIQRARFVVAALNICEGMDLEEMETLPPGILNVLLRASPPAPVSRIRSRGKT